MKVINEEKVHNFLKKVTYNDCIFVFDFDGTITTKSDA
jgi:phosphatidate phosphatase PAH1